MFYLPNKYTLPAVDLNQIKDMNLSINRVIMKIDKDSQWKALVAQVGVKRKLKLFLDIEDKKVTF